MGVPEQLAERMSMAEQHEYLRARFSRRNLMRGGAVTIGAVAGGAFVPGAVAQAAVPTQRTAPATAQQTSGRGNQRQEADLVAHDVANDVERVTAD